MRDRYFIPLSVGFLLFSVALVMWSGRRPTPSPIRVVLVGTTNDASGVLLYCFRATNTAERQIARWAEGASLREIYAEQVGAGELIS